MCGLPRVHEKERTDILPSLSDPRVECSVFSAAALNVLLKPTANEIEQRNSFQNP